MGVLTTVGVLQNGKISNFARNKFISDVKNLLLSGNSSKDPFWLIPIPPFFPSDSPSLFPISDLENKQKYPIWHKLFIDTLLEGTANALDLKGSTPFFPVADPCSVAVQLGLPAPDIDLDVSLGLFPVPTPEAILELLEINPVDIPELLAKIPTIEIPGIPSPPSIPSIPTPNLFIPTPSLPLGVSINIPFPSLPPFPAPVFPAIPTFSIPTIPGLPSLFGCILGAIPLIFLQVVAQFPQLTESLPKGPQGIIKFFAGIIITLLLSCFEQLGLVIGKMFSFIAGFIVYVKYLIIFCILGIIASLLGEGCLVIGLASLLLA